VIAETLNSERIVNGANCTGALAGVLEDMVAYSQERHAFGKPIGQFQAVQHMIADTYAVQPHVTPVALHVVLERVAIAAEHLHAAIGAAEARLRRGDLGHRRLDPRTADLGPAATPRDRSATGPSRAPRGAHQQRDGPRHAGREPRASALVLSVDASSTKRMVESVRVGAEHQDNEGPAARSSRGGPERAPSPLIAPARLVRDLLASGAPVVVTAASRGEVRVIGALARWAGGQVAGASVADTSAA
jgi:hypothetical protein